VVPIIKKGIGFRVSASRFSRVRERKQVGPNRDALTYSKVHKAATSYRCDAGRMEVLLAWFREYPAESITAQDIERQFQKQEWAPATPNRYRALLSLTYRLAIRNGKLKENPARLVAHGMRTTPESGFCPPTKKRICARQ